MNAESSKNMATSTASTSLATLTTSIGFQNPIFDDQETSGLDLIINSNENRASSNKAFNNQYNVSIDELKQINDRASFSMANSEMDLLCFNRVYTVKTRTYINFKKSIKMLKPFIILLVMVAILVGLFRLDILVGSGNVSGGDDS